MTLYDLRTQAGKSYEDVSRDIGVSWTSVRNWENNLTSPQVKQLPKLAKAYGVGVLTVLEACLNGRV